MSVDMSSEQRLYRVSLYTSAEKLVCFAVRRQRNALSNLCSRRLVVS